MTFIFCDEVHNVLLQSLLSDLPHRLLTPDIPAQHHFFCILLSRILFSVRYC